MIEAAVYSYLYTATATTAVVALIWYCCRPLEPGEGKALAKAGAYVLGAVTVLYGVVLWAANPGLFKWW